MEKGEAPTPGTRSVEGNSPPERRAQGRARDRTRQCVSLVLVKSERSPSACDPVT